MITHDLTALKPDYLGGSIVNLMASLGARLGAPRSDYARLKALPDERLQGAKRVALVVIDGLGAELLSHLGAASALARLQTATMTSVYPPTTATAITTFMSGLAPQQHGLTGWFMHFRKLGAVTAVLPFMPRYARAPLAAAGIAPGALIDAPSFAARISAPAAALLPHDLVESDYSRLLGAGARRDGYRGLADFAQRLTHFCEGRDVAEYMYAYWPELDHLAHLHGPSSARLADHFSALDAALAPLAEIAAAHGTLLIITADHGFIDSGPDERIDLEQHPALAAMLSLPLCGEPRSAYAYVRASCVAHFEDYVQSELAHAIELHRSDDFIASGWFGIGAAHNELAARVGDFVLCLRERYTLRDQVVGEHNAKLLGVHGGITRAEQVVPLLLAGP